MGSGPRRELPGLQAQPAGEHELGRALTLAEPEGTSRGPPPLRHPSRTYLPFSFYSHPSQGPPPATGFARPLSAPAPAAPQSHGPRGRRPARLPGPLESGAEVKAGSEPAGAAVGLSGPG